MATNLGIVVPHIDPQTKHWMLGTTDLGVVAEGKTPTVNIDPTTKHWILNGQDSGIVAEGKNGSVSTIDPTTKHWLIDGVDTGIIAEGQDGGQGPAGTVNVGSTTTGDPGTDAQVIEGGTPQNRTLSFVIPKGAKGDKGDPGGGGTDLTEISYEDYIALRDGAGLDPDKEYLVYGVPDSQETHDQLLGRDAPDQHPIGSITGLSEEINTRASQSDMTWVKQFLTTLVKEGVVHYPELAINGPMAAMTINLQDVLDVEEADTRTYLGDGSDYTPPTGDYSIVRSGDKAHRKLVYTTPENNYTIIENGVILLHDPDNPIGYTIPDKWVLRSIAGGTPTSNSWYTTYDKLQIWLDEFGYWPDMREVHATIAKTIGYKTSFRDSYLSEPNDLYLDTLFPGITMPDGQILDTYHSSINPYSTWADLIKDPRYTTNAIVHVTAHSTLTEDMNITVGSDGNPIRKLQVLAEGSEDAVWVEAHKLFINETGEIRIKGFRFTKAVNIVKADGTVALEQCSLDDYFNADIASSDGFISVLGTTFSKDLTLTADTSDGDFGYFYFNTCWGAAGSGNEGGSVPKVVINSPKAFVQMVGCTQFMPDRKQGVLEATDCTFVGRLDTDETTKLPGVHSDNTLGKIDLIRCTSIMPDGSKAPIRFEGGASLNISTSEFDWGGSLLGQR